VVSIRASETEFGFTTSRFAIRLARSADEPETVAIARYGTVEYDGSSRTALTQRASLRYANLEPKVAFWPSDYPFH